MTAKDGWAPVDRIALKNRWRNIPTADMRQAWQVYASDDLDPAATIREAEHAAFMAGWQAAQEVGGDAA